MMPIAVRPIARPLSARRTKSFGMAWRTGEFGYSSSAVNRPAEIMKVPRQAASIRYSGQCCCSARIMFAFRQEEVDLSALCCHQTAFALLLDKHMDGQNIHASTSADSRVLAFVGDERIFLSAGLADSPYGWSSFAMSPVHPV